MPDWTALVRSRLAGLVLEPKERSEVIEELAAHLEDACAEIVRAGHKRRGLCPARSIPSDRLARSE
jgi:hypothetical protein